MASGGRMPHGPPGWGSVQPWSFAAPKGRRQIAHVRPQGEGGGQATRPPGVNRRGHAQPCRQIDAVGMRGRAGAFLSAGEAAEATGGYRQTSPPLLTWYEFD